MATGAPFGGLDSDGVLHVLDALAIPLIVEGREMMRGAGPLVINVCVALFASLGFQEKLSGDLRILGHFDRSGGKRSRETAALVVHGGRRDCWVFDVVGSLPTRGAHPPCAVRNSRE